MFSFKKKSNPQRETQNKSTSKGQDTASPSNFNIAQPYTNQEEVDKFLQNSAFGKEQPLQAFKIEDHYRMSREHAVHQLQADEMEGERDPIEDGTALKTAIREILEDSEKKIIPKCQLSKEKNVDKVFEFVASSILSESEYRMLGDVYESRKKGIEERLSNFKDKENFKTWLKNVLKRIEGGADELLKDVEHWRSETEKASKAVVIKVHDISLTGSDIHNKGLGVAIVKFVGIPTKGNKSKTLEKKVVIKPDDRSFEKALLGSNSNSIASQFNQKAGLDAEDAIKTIHIGTSKERGSIVEYIEETELNEKDKDKTEKYKKAIQSSVNLELQEDGESGQPLLETMAFSFLMGLMDLHGDNVRYQGNKPFLTDAEVGLQPFIYDRQYTHNEETEESGIRVLYEDSGFQKDGFREPYTNDPENFATIRSQIQGNKGSEGSSLLAWAKANSNKLEDIIKEKIKNTKVRITPIHTGTLIQARSLFLGQYFKGEREDEDYTEVLYLLLGSGAILNHFTFIGDKSFGLVRLVGPDTSGAYVFNKNTIVKEFKKDFKKGIIPKMSYQPSTGKVTYNGLEIWQGYDLDYSMSVLMSRLAGKE